MRLSAADAAHSENDWFGAETNGGTVSLGAGWCSMGPGAVVHNSGLGYG